MPILGVIASSVSGNLIPPYAPSYESIATYVIGAGGSSSVTFSSIPGTYQHLQVRTIQQNSISGSSDLKFTFNGDGAANYSQHYLYTAGSTVNSAATASATYVPGAMLGVTGTPAPSVCDILDYANTNKFKTTKTMMGYDDSSSTAYFFLTSGFWRNTAAITSITCTPLNGTMQQYTTIALYGIKG
jgi:hypothetical protein